MTPRPPSERSPRRSGVPTVGPRLRRPGVTLGPRANRTIAKILDATRRIFLVRGYAGTTVDEIMREAGVSRGSFYTYFPSKRDVLLALGVNTLEAATEVIRALENLPTPRRAAVLEKWVGTYFEMLDEHGSFVFAFTQAAAEDEELRRAGMVDHLELCRRMGVAVGGPGTEDATELGLTVSAMFERAWTYSQLYSDRTTLVRRDSGNARRLGGHRWGRVIRFEMTELTGDERALQSEVRAFLAEELPRGSFMPGLGMNGAKDPAFSAKLGRRGWLGMALPVRYGGHDRSAVDRLIVTEELLRWGAPVGHHWVADRQTGPVIARFGTEAQKQRFLPAICRGEVSFSIGMSEPDSGSDLASLSTRAVRDGDGWVLTGRKIWTTLAAVNDWFVVLCRTTPVEEAGDKRRGLSQLIVDLHSPGVHITPIPFIDGTAEFCEVVLDEVFVPGELVLGEVGAGWTQNTSELAFERGGPERWLSTYLVVEELLRSRPMASGDDALVDLLGTATASYWVLHNLTLSIARAIDAGRSPTIEASLMKEMGTRFEQDVLNTVLAVVDDAPGLPSRSLFEQLLVVATLTAPSFTIRGGTNEILRSVAAKGLQPS